MHLAGMIDTIAEIIMIRSTIVAHMTSVFPILVIVVVVLILILILLPLLSLQ